MNTKEKIKYVKSLFDDGTKLYNQKKFDEAESKLKEAHNLASKSEDIMYNLALVYFEKKQYDLAWDLVDKIKEIDCKELIQELKNGGFVRKYRSHKSSKIECPKCGYILNESTSRCPECYFEFEDESSLQQQKVIKTNFQMYENKKWKFSFYYPKEWVIISQNTSSGTWDVPINVGNKEGTGGPADFIVAVKKVEVLKAYGDNPNITCI